MFYKDVVMLGDLRFGAGSSQTALTSLLDLRAPKANPTFTGTTTCNNLAVSGSRLEVAAGLTNTQLDGFNSIYFSNMNSGGHHQPKRVKFAAGKVAD